MQSRLSCFRLVTVLLSVYAVSLAIPLGTVLAQAAAPAASDKPGTDKQNAEENDADNKDKEADKDFLGMDIEQLRKTSVGSRKLAADVPAGGATMDVGITSVAKHESTIRKSAAAVYVITPEMIRRSGVTSVPDALRMVPGMDVARYNSHIWAISCRGFNSQFANKLLVLIDGRTVYNQLFGGVYWDVQDMLLEDIARIEVIRGPGGALWGSNAVNGVINIITKKAQDTQGSLVIAGGGNLDNLIDGVRVGGNNGDGMYWRVYGKHFERGNEYAAAGAHDAWRIGRGGFRLDWEFDKRETNRLTVLGNYYGGTESQELLIPEPVAPYQRTTIDNFGVSGANVLARFDHRIDADSNWTLQTYFDRTYRNEYSASKQMTNTFDVEFQHNFPLAKRHDFTWGLNYRQVHDYLPDTLFVITYTPRQRTTDLFSGFLQDEIELVDDKLVFTIGTKLEQNSYSGFEAQPNARLLWTPDERQAVWASISRAVRIPTRYDENVTSNGRPFFVTNIPFFLRALGNPDLKAEALMSYEIGYRVQATERFSWDVTGFCNIYENLVGSEFETPFVENTYVVLPYRFVNNQRAHLYGVELSAQWSISENWRVSSSYSSLYSYGETYDGTNISGLLQGTVPRNQAQIQSSWDLGKNWDFDLWLRYVDELAYPAEFLIPSVPAYITMDLRLGWRPNKNFEAALVGQNLFDNHHPEFLTGGSVFVASEVRRTVYAQLTWRR